MSASRWLAWTRKRDPLIEEAADLGPPKPPKVTFEGFAGATPGLSQEIGEPTTMPTPAGLPAEKRESGDKTFPHCPRCASYALYRRNNTGTYECQTCNLREIDEAVARRLN